MSGLRTALMVLLLIMPASVMGHGFLKTPISRNWLAHGIGENFCPHCGQGDGTDGVKARIAATGGTVFPDMGNSEGTHGLCGDPFQGSSWKDIPEQPHMVPTEVQATYTEGDVVEFEISMSTNHDGYFEFRICDHVLDQSLASQVAGQACLDQHVLQRVKPEDNPDCQAADGSPISVLQNPDCQPLDPCFPTRWWLPKQEYGIPAGAGDHESVSRNFKMKYKIPWGLTCTKCTLQWWWLSANSCNPIGQAAFWAKLRETFPEVVGTPYGSFDGPGTCSLEKQGEQFWNCADIKIEASGSPAPSPVLEEAPLPYPECAVSAVNITGPCGDLPDGLVAEWGACTATKQYENGCCQPHLECFEDNPHYAQCRQPVASPSPPPYSSPSPAPSSPTPAPPTTAAPPAPSSPTPSPPTTVAPPPPTTAAPPVSPTPSTTPVPPEPVAGCSKADAIGLYGNCTGQHSGCCGAGLLCFVLDSTYAQCRHPNTCPCSGWDCSIITDPNICSMNKGKKYGNCFDNHCCEDGLVCYEQDGTYAQCLPEGTCPSCDSWSCNVLLPGVAPPAASRRSLKSFDAQSNPEHPDQQQDSSHQARLKNSSSSFNSATSVAVVASVMVISAFGVALKRKRGLRLRPSPVVAEEEPLRCISSQD